jgi:NCS1 family nucleobase:cation symporter-1
MTTDDENSIAPHLRHFKDDDDDDDDNDDDDDEEEIREETATVSVELPDMTSIAQQQPPPRVYYNSDIRESLDPIPQSLQTWRFYHYAAIWIALSINIYSFILGPSLVIQAGMSWWLALLCVFTGSVITLIPLILNAHPGVKYGVSFPVVARKCFGVRGSILIASIRGLVGIGWFSLQTYVGGKALYIASTAIIPILSSPTLYMGDWIGLNFWQFFCFIVFLVTNAFCVLGGIERVKLLQIFTAPLLIISALVLMIWAIATTGFKNIITETYTMRSSESTTRPFGINIMIALSSVVGTWSTMMLNITDFSRYGKSQKDQIIGQVLGLPFVMTLCAFIGIVSTAAGSVKYGEVYPDPLDLFHDFPNRWITALACFILAISVLAANTTANLVSAVNDWVNMNPQLISFRIATIATCIIGGLMFPWKLFESGHNFVMVWLVGSGGLMGSICGVLIADYWVIRLIIPPKIPFSLKLEHSPNSPLSMEQQSPPPLSPQKTIITDRPVDLRFNVEHLYLGRDSIYYHTHGFHLKAFLATFLSILPGFTGFLANLGIISTNSVAQWVLDLYDLGWFVSVSLSMLLYIVFNVLFHFVFKRLKWKTDVVTTDAKIKRWKSRDNFLELNNT